ncbi:MAG: hypothetical protein ACC642_12040 [Pseudomonadales bacterium]
MSRAKMVWGVLAFVYGVFFYWYTSFGGPLSDEEISRYVSLIESRGAGSEDIERMRTFLENDSGDDFVMVNIIELNETPVAVPGVDPTESSSQVLGRYMAYMWPALLTRASHPVIFGAAAAESMDVWGIDGAEKWSQAAFMRYRSRRDMMEIATNPDFQGPHEYKIAAMAKTIAFPADPWMSAGDPRLLLALVFVIVGLLFGRTR